MTPKIKKILIIGYIAFLIVATITVISVLGMRNIEISNKEIQKSTEAVKPIKGTLQIKEGNKEVTYTYNMENINTVRDLLDMARLDKKLDFEITQYTNRIAIDYVNMVKSDDTRAWRILHNGKDVTNEMDSLKLIHRDVYELVLVSLKP